LHFARGAAGGLSVSAPSFARHIEKQSDKHTCVNIDALNAIGRNPGAFPEKDHANREAPRAFPLA
jgi:hypothetical protein